MSLKIENLENSMVKLTIEATAEEFGVALQKAYQKDKGSINVPGFRKGKVPMAIIEKMYGPAVFYEDAANVLIPEAYEKAYDESKLDIMSRPEIDVVQIEKGKPFIFTATVAVKPEVTLGEYKGIEVKKVSIRVTEKDINAEIEKEREAQSRMVNIEDRPAADGDMTSIDFEGFLNGTAFEGGKGENYPLTLGSHSFIEGFEEQIVGMNIGEEKEINVTFPEEYGQKELAGQPAVFKVKLNEIKVKELPEVDDEFAAEVSEFDTLEEYKASVKKTIKERKEKEAKTQKEDEAIEKLVAASSMDMPEPIIEGQIESMINDMEARMQQQGLTLQQYMQYTGMDESKLKEQSRPQAVKRIQTRLVLEKVAEAEGLTVSDEKFDEEIKNMAASYNMEADKLKELIQDKEKEQIEKDILVQMAVDVVRDASVEVKK